MDTKDISVESKQKIDLMFKITQRIDFWINTTNTKAAFVTTLNTLYLGIFLSKWDDILNNFSAYPTFRIFIHIMMLIATLCSTISLILVFSAVSPYLLSLAAQNKQTSSYRSDLFFGDIAKYASGEEYHQVVLNRTEVEHIKDLAYQVYSLSKAAHTKFDLLSLSIWFVMLGEVFPIALLLASKISISIGK